MKKGAIFLLIVCASVSALAQERSFLTKPQVEGLAIGKKWIHFRTADGNQVSWDIRAGGQLFANNLTSGQRETGSWVINDDAQLCVKWRGPSVDRCVALIKQTLQMVDSKDLKRVYADLSIE